MWGIFGWSGSKQRLFGFEDFPTRFYEVKVFLKQCAVDCAQWFGNRSVTIRSSVHDWTLDRLTQERIPDRMHITV